MNKKEKMNKVCCCNTERGICILGISGFRKVWWVLGTGSVSLLNLLRTLDLLNCKQQVYFSVAAIRLTEAIAKKKSGIQLKQEIMV